MRSDLPFSGPIFELIDSVLRDEAAYRQFRAGRVGRSALAALLDGRAAALEARGVPASDVHFAKRFPASIDGIVAESLETLARSGVTPRADCPAALMDEVASTIRHRFDHRGQGTYIYPEEGRLLLGIAHAIRARSAVFLGSYYGYWAAWALRPILAAGGHAVLVDPDPIVCEIARRNLHRIYPAERVEIVVATGEAYMARTHDRFDLVVLDAELPRDHPDTARRGKGIYFHLLQAALPHLAERATLVCHNILFADHSGADFFFDEVIGRNELELGPFKALVASEFDRFVELPTTEGVGVGIRTSPCPTAHVSTEAR
jgi:predicted O-methyltransferase YrrM